MAVYTGGSQPWFQEPHAVSSTFCAVLSSHSKTPLIFTSKTRSCLGMILITLMESADDEGFIG